MITPQIPILQFVRTLRWLDGTPMLETMEGYRQKILTDAIDTWDEWHKRPMYNQALTGRGKKNAKTLDGLLFLLHRCLAWKSDLGNDCLLVSFDLEQANEALGLLKKLIRKNPPLSQRLTIKAGEIHRRDYRGYIKIVSGRDIYGQHGKSFLGLHVNELQTQRDYSLLEGLQHDPNRLDAFTWFESYDTLLRRPGIPMFDMVQRGKSGEDKRFYFSWYAGDYCSDPAFASKATAPERANPSLTFINGFNEYIAQQRLRLPAHLYRRLHENIGGQVTGAAFAAESILNSTATGVRVRPPVEGLNYAAGCDMSDGSNDDAVLAIGHLNQENQVIVDLVINQQAPAPFDPLAACELFALTLKQYKCLSVTLDRFAHNTFSSAFAKQDISAYLSELTTHQTYEAFGPRLNSGQIVLLDNSDLQNQFLGLIWKGARIDHASSEHDDYAAAVARLANVLSTGEIDWDAYKAMNAHAPERAMNKQLDWISQGEGNGGSIVDRMWDSGDLFKRNKFDW